MIKPQDLMRQTKVRPKPAPKAGAIDPLAARLEAYQSLANGKTH